MGPQPLWATGRESLAAFVRSVVAAALFLAARFLADRPARHFIIALILANLSFAVLYLAHYALPSLDLAGPFLLLDHEQSLPELLNYAQTLLCAALLLALYVQVREQVYLGWAAIFSFVAADDALSLHERGAWVLRAWIDLPALPGLRVQDTGELLVWAACAVPLLVLLILGFRRSNPEARAFAGVFAILFATLVFFAVAFDMLHSLMRGASFRVERLLALAEDGGEMLTLALACGSALLLHRHRLTESGLRVRGTQDATQADAASLGR